MDKLLTWRAATARLVDHSKDGITMDSYGVLMEWPMLVDIRQKVCGHHTWCQERGLAVGPDAPNCPAVDHSSTSDFRSSVVKNRSILVDSDVAACGCLQSCCTNFLLVAFPA